MSILNLTITEDDCHSVKISLSQLFPDVPSDKTIMSFDLDVIVIYFISCRFMATSKEGCLFLGIGPIKDSVAYALQNYYQGAKIQSIDIDDMRDLEFRQKECRECAETSSYEEYQIKRAAQNLPDEAGSEKTGSGCHSTGLGKSI